MTLTRYRSGDIEVRARRQVWARKIDLVVLSYEAGEVGARRVALGTNITFETLKDESSIVEPTLQLDDHFAQRLMDELWDCGIRPTQGKGSAGQLEAVQRHLGDMRAIVAKTVKAELP